MKMNKFVIKKNHLCEGRGVSLHQTSSFLADFLLWIAIAKSIEKAKEREIQYRIAGIFDRMAGKQQLSPFSLK